MPPEQQAPLDSAFAALLADLATAQEAYCMTLVDEAPRNTYLQIPPGGDWSALGLATPTAFTAWVDEYVAADGCGFVLVAEAVVDGVTYRKVQQVGSEPWRDRDWTEVAA